MTVYQKIAIVGLGLMGGSLLKRIYACFPGTDVYGIDSDRDVLRKAEPYLYQGFTSIYDLPESLDLVFICVPQAVFVDTVKAISNQVSPLAILTDILSVKRTSFEAVKDLNLSHEFIWAHPMAGKEVSGFDNSEASLLVDKPYIVIGSFPERPLQDFKSFITALGATVVSMDDVSSHDAAVGEISHFPYLMASLTVPEEVGMLGDVLGSGFKDTTRVASSSSVWGVDVLISNKEIIQKKLTQLETNISRVNTFLNENDEKGLSQFLESRRAIRARLIQS